MGVIYKEERKWEELWGKIHINKLVDGDLSIMEILGMLDL